MEQNRMKRLWCRYVAVVLFLLSPCCVAHAAIGERDSDVTTFLGIPVDGKPEDVKKHLRGKGFVVAKEFGQNFFSGEYEGERVILCVASNKGRVARIGVTDAMTRSAEEIKKRYNALIKRYAEDENYVSFEGDNELIADNEDVDYELRTNDKVYEADFYQQPKDENASREVMEKKFVWFKICEDGGYFYIVMFFDNVYNLE